MSDQITITLPDGATREYAAGTTGGDVAADISKSLAKSALAVRIDGRLADLSEPLDAVLGLRIVTAKVEAAA
ncbi:MAG: TGS domain-containing protein, partial [Pseudomonadota bacterium]